MTTHQKINFRSHFDTSEPRSKVPYSEVKKEYVRAMGHTVLAFKSEPYNVRIQGTKYNRRGSKLKH